MPTNIDNTLSQLPYKATKSTVMSIKGRPVSVTQPLVCPYGKPRGGWKVSIKVKDIEHEVNGPDGGRVFNNVAALLRKNNISYTNLNLWVNLNLQWYSRMPEKHMLVRHADLLDIVTTKDVGHVRNPSSRNYTPTHWGQHAWNFMGMYLARDDYSFDGFLRLIDMVLEMLDNHRNRSIGCYDCHLEFSKEVAKIKNQPLHTVEAARKWLVEFHNSVNVRLNKPVRTYEFAERQYLWQ